MFILFRYLIADHDWGFVWDSFTNVNKFHVEHLKNKQNPRPVLYVGRQELGTQAPRLQDLIDFHSLIW